MFRLSLRENLDLRLLEPRHATALFQRIEHDREDLREWLSWVDHTACVRDVETHVQKVIRQFARNEGVPVGIWWRGEIVGSIALNRLDWPNRRTEIGYWLGVPFRGLGIMTDSCRALVRYAFDELELQRVEIRCATENRRSRAIPERLGFQLEGTLRQAQRLDQGFVDHAVYGLLRSDSPAYLHEGSRSSAACNSLLV